VDQINVSNTRVNTTIINNVYNTTIVNRNVTVNNITYVNRGVPGAIAATSSQAFRTAQPIGQNRLRVDSRTVAEARVEALAPVTAPTRQALQGAGRVTVVQPPRTVQTRTVIARTVPPIRTGVVRIAPPATSKMTRSVGTGPMPARTGAPMPAPAVTRTPTPTPTPEAAREAAPMREPVSPVHVNELPVAPRVASPSVANSALEREHLQAQQQLQAQQAAERERVQQQQEAEHAQLARQQAEAAKQQADAARQRQMQEQLERQHQQQTEQLAQQHARDLQQLQEKQQEQRRQQENQTKPAAPAHREPAGPNPKP
jgi:flagellar biosynthesis GTPase FlhF